MRTAPLRRSSPVLRLSSVEQARRLGLDNALGLAASTGFERIELTHRDLADSSQGRLELKDLLRELRLVAAAVSVPWQELREIDPIELCRSAEQLGCHRLVVSVDPSNAPTTAGEVGRALDALGYRLAGRSATLTVRVETTDPDERTRVAGRILRDLSQSAVALELEAGDHALFTRWADRARAIAVADHLLLEPPAGSWGTSASPGEVALGWLRARPATELVVRHERRALDEGEALTLARSRWRREIENRERGSRRSTGPWEDSPARRLALGPARSPSSPRQPPTVDPGL